MVKNAKRLSFLVAIVALFAPTVKYAFKIIDTCSQHQKQDLNL
jgi:hypothetical protein